MTTENHRIARDFFAALSAGDLPDALLTDDLTAFTTTSGDGIPKARYQGGIRMFVSLFKNGLHYIVDSLTAEDDRVIAEVHAEGTLVNEENFSNRYVFALRIRDGRIASIAEHFNPDPVRKQILPLLQVVMAKQAD
ncbi:MAG: nuclear transport factor 2 family protein [Sphingobium sp.]